MTTQRIHADGYIEKRLGDDGKTRYFFLIQSPGYCYGPLRDTQEEAVTDGREECEKRGLYVPCFQN